MAKLVKCRFSFIKKSALKSADRQIYANELSDKGNNEENSPIARIEVKHDHGQLGYCAENRVDIVGCSRVLARRGERDFRATYVQAEIGERFVKVLVHEQDNRDDQAKMLRQQRA